MKIDKIFLPRKEGGKYWYLLVNNWYINPTGDFYHFHKDSRTEQFFSTYINVKNCCMRCNTKITEEEVSIITFIKQFPVFGWTNDN